MDETSENRMGLPNPDKMKSVIVAATLALWLALVGFGLSTVLFSWPPEQRFLSLTENCYCRCLNSPSLQYCLMYLGNLS